MAIRAPDGANKKDEGKRNFLLHMSARDREWAENKDEARSEVVSKTKTWTF